MHCNLLESSQGCGNVDRAAGVIKDVKVLGAKSKNGRTYSPQAMEQAAKLYEGIGVNADHPGRDTPSQNRSIRDALGWLENVKVKADGVYADLHILKSHPVAGTIFECAERHPARIGLSHNSSGHVKNVGGKTIVEGVDSVRSVDLVQNPATVNSLFESVQEDPMYRSQRPRFNPANYHSAAEREFVRNLMEMDGMVPPTDGITTTTTGVDDMLCPTKPIPEMTADELRAYIATLQTKLDSMSAELAPVSESLFESNSRRGEQARAARLKCKREIEGQLSDARHQQFLRAIGAKRR